MEIDIQAEKQKYQTQLDQFVKQLGELDNQRALLLQAITERRGILAFLEQVSKDEHEEEKITS